MNAEVQPEVSRRHIMRGKLLESLPKGGVVAEVGVWEGNFSERILEICQPKKLHLIDPWLYQPEFGETGFGRKKNKDRMEQIYNDVAAKFEGNKKVEIHRAKSEEALMGMKDGSLDWVYLDGNHNSPFIDMDIAMSLKKVKPNGIISGDDYNWMAEKKGAPVKMAVQRVLADLGDKAEFVRMANQWKIILKRGG